MLRFAAPLKDHLGINHFWYYKITFSGHYSYLGTHAPWSEFCFDNAMISHFPCLRHPKLLQTGISLMKSGADSEYKKVLDAAWDRFNINFNLNLISRIPDGIEAFGFASCVNDHYAEQRLLNNFSLLKYFIKAFRAKHKKLFQLLENNQINLFTHFGSAFYSYSTAPAIPIDRDQFLKKMGFGWVLSLTPRELDVLKYISNGYPASFIAEQLNLQKRTVENYIATIKSKLVCNSKVELIQKAQEIIPTGYFD